MASRTQRPSSWALRLASRRCRFMGPSPLITFQNSSQGMGPWIQFPVFSS